MIEGKISVGDRMKELKSAFKFDRYTMIMFMVIALAFVLGYLIAAKRYEVIANNYIMEKCIEVARNPFGR